MNIYQESIKVRKVCESQPICKDCPYYKQCSKSKNLRLHPTYEDIKVIAKTIKEEKWKIS